MQVWTQEMSSGRLPGLAMGWRAGWVVALTCGLGLQSTAADVQRVGQRGWASALGLAPADRPGQLMSPLPSPWGPLAPPQVETGQPSEANPGVKSQRCVLLAKPLSPGRHLPRSGCEEGADGLAQARGLCVRRPWILSVQEAPGPSPACQGLEVPSGHGPWYLPAQHGFCGVISSRVLGHVLWSHPSVLWTRRQRFGRGGDFPAPHTERPGLRVAPGTQSYSVCF